MNMTEKNGQPSMEEILASIRRIIAEEPANQAYGDFRGSQPIVLKGDGVLDDAGDFDLPAIFRSSSLPAPDRPAPLLGRLTDAIRNATATPVDGASNGEDHAHSNGASLNGAKPDVHQPYQGLSSLQPVRTEVYRSDDAVAVNGSGHVNGAHNGHAHAAAAPVEPVAPANSASADISDQPKRVMASFKDTHFMKMSAPAASPVPTPAPAAVAETPLPVSPVAFTPVASFEPEAVPPVMAHVEEILEDVPAPQVIAMPPPPLPVSAVPAGDAIEGVGSIEDTTADLLRPMLRQWLADNMPRMVEKALHIEIAESVKPLKKL
ncbi:DUF2497 domain-containing protein [Hyphomicrobium sp.]|uniref:DUF2497 domain-containing protein n=1 Tax=Hyphomicrobium sp. TaxID=82 RepID=UPI002BA7759F|nr:DUF2497 domain-containing protein [Hyphomicrobium sp.]HRN88577.1 DUF2497 domain-containing protein [Hyphomicrobium sp.]HRQ27093.1 DUF2497 domain-containing protein [Hyphomicrobium sp.]